MAISTHAQLMVSAEGTHRRLQNLEPQILSLVGKVLHNPARRYVLGDQVAALEQAIETAWHVPAVAVSSGTAALESALLAANIGPGDEVIVPTLTFASTAFAVTAVGATPVFVDIHPDTYTLSPQAVRSAITDNTAAILPVHLYGQMADMQPLLALANDYHLVVIEDAAQAHGARYHGQYAGSLGDFGCFSLYYGKNIGGLGDAGLVTFRNPAQREHLLRLRDLGRTPGERYVHEEWGLRARMSEIDAAVIHLELGYLEDWNVQRQSIAACYDAAFADLPLRTPPVAAGRAHAYYKYPVLARSAGERAKLEQYLHAAEIAIERIYPTLVPFQPAYKTGLPQRTLSVAVASDVVSRLLCLPIYPELRQDELDHVITAVRNFYEYEREVSP